MTADAAAALAAQRKRLAHRSRYRGFLENDIVFRRFAAEVLPALDAAALDLYERLLAEADHDLWDWVLGRRPVPARHDHAVMRRLRALHGTLGHGAG